MSTLFDPLLKYSSLRTDYLESLPNRSILDRWSLSSIIINFAIPVCLLIVLVFILKYRYDNKQKKIELAKALQKQIKINKDKLQKQESYKKWDLEN